MDLEADGSINPLVVDDEMTRVHVVLEEENSTITGNNTNDIEHAKSFTCPICLDDHDIVDGVALRDCSHTFCRWCIVAYLSSHIRDGELSFVCPGGDATCSVAISEDEVRDIIDGDTFHRYTRFKQLKENPQYRECPKCIHSFSADIGDTAVNTTCPACGVTYCLIHSLAHPDVTCKEYTQKQQTTQKISNKLIRQMSRPCPRCGCDTEKAGGCNHMTCRQCGENWCYLCGRTIKSTDHYNTLSGCPGKQFSDGPDIVLWIYIPCLRSEWLHALSRAPHVLFALFVFPAMLVAVIAAAGVSLALLPLVLLCTCCATCMSDGDSEVCKRVSGVTSMIFLVVLASLVVTILGILELLWCPLAFLLWCLAFSCGRFYRPEVFKLSAIQVLDPDKKGYMHMYWWFPFSAVEHMVGTSLTDFTAEMRIRMES